MLVKNYYSFLLKKVFNNEDLSFMIGLLFFYHFSLIFPIIVISHIKGINYKLAVTKNIEEAGRLDYAQAQGLGKNSFGWWTRNLLKGQGDFPWMVTSNGGISLTPADRLYGVRPACWITL